ncbi:MAG: PHP domain-containing protein [Defluviitaleaceae bacterium]|nr:PHP domain-containing protein [Defluviitaleaceae bacterium]
MHFDAHVHSVASPDSELAPLNAIAALKAKGLGVAFTEHVDYVTPTQGKDMTATDAPMASTDFIYDFNIYPSQYKSFRDPKSVLLGVEICLNAAYYPLNNQLAGNDFDFIVGAVHYVNGVDIYNSAIDMEPENFCREYLTYSKEMVEYCGFFDTFAHIDYVTRYSEGINKVFHYKNFSMEFDALLKTIAERELAFEINTARFGNPNVMVQLLPIYKRFHELGGKYVTIGSDAHTERALGRFYSNAIGLANMAELTPVYYCERKRYECK